MSVKKMIVMEIGLKKREFMCNLANNINQVPKPVFFFHVVANA